MCVCGGDGNSEKKHLVREEGSSGHMSHKARWGSDRKRSQILNIKLKNLGGSLEGSICCSRWFNSVKVAGWITGESLGTGNLVSRYFGNLNWEWDEEMMAWTKVLLIRKERKDRKFVFR